MAGSKEIDSMIAWFLWTLWNILKQIFKGEITNHGEYVSMFAVITQVAIEHGEPLFQVNSQDPYYDDCYFDESDDEDEEDYE
jgi:hypothetical protein